MARQILEYVHIVLRGAAAVGRLHLARLAI